jgi:ribosomal protein L11 methylase PrmA
LKQYPALTVGSVADPDLLAAAVDDFSPTAIESRESDIRVFFATPADRDAACAALAARFDVTAIDVSDEDWARRSQENLEPITVGHITVAAPWAAINHLPLAISHEPLAIVIVITPSMGFGTGHHATTRLCLAALQVFDLRDQTVLDVGTGSGVLAIAAERLGARRAIGIDNDADAIQSARENLEVNPAVRHVTFEIGDLTASPERGARGFPPPLDGNPASFGDRQPSETGSPAASGSSASPQRSPGSRRAKGERLALQLRSGQADVVTANLTSTLLVRSASTLLANVRAGGTLILSGLLAHERDEVCRAFAPAPVVWEWEEDGWVGLAMKKP